jgi:hypothetical protein
MRKKEKEEEKTILKKDSLTKGVQNTPIDTLKTKEV